MNSAPKDNPPSTSRTLRWTISGVISLILIGAAGYWWRTGGREQFFLFLQSDFRVIHIDRQNDTMTLTRPGETVIVTCSGVCDFFRIGKKYSMMNRGGVLEFKSTKGKLELKILEQHLEFEKLPGGQG